MHVGKIEYFNRYTGRKETEQVYGDRFLRWAYDTVPGRLALHLVVKRTVFSRFYGWCMDRPGSRKRIASFIRNYGVDASEFADPVESFQTFNEFFHRKLKPAARPVDDHPRSAVFPADGRHLGFEEYSAADGLLVKGERFRLKELLQDQELAERYTEGALLISRLCPVDYHRFHFPVHGKPSRPVLLNGPLFSVNPIALRRNVHILARNKRYLTMIDSEEFGLVLMLEVGATCVGSIVHTFPFGVPVRNGDEKGYFKFGGSSTITLFEPGRIRFSEDLLAQSAQNRELYARMGDRLGIGKA